VTTLILKRFDNEIPDTLELGGVSLHLASLYSGIERILVLELEARGFKVAKSDTWHVEILAKALSTDIITADVYNELKGLLGFRHFLRHAYSFQVKPQLIMEMLQRVPSFMDKLFEKLES